MEHAKAEERRNHERYALEVGNLVTISDDGKAYEGVIVDISLGGMCVRFLEAAPALVGVFSLQQTCGSDLLARQSWIRGSAMGVEFAMEEDSELARTLKCVQVVVNATSEGSV